MVVRSISSDEARESFDQLLKQVRDSGDQVVLTVDGSPMAMVVPLSEPAQYESFRAGFGRFWDARKAYLRANPPPPMTEDEEMEWALQIQRDIRAELNAEDETAALESVGRAARSA